MSLPAEILDHILSFLQPDTTALETCSESHPSLCQLAEPYLYSDILLDTYEQRSKPANLTELLSKRPYIAHYVRSLGIRVREPHRRLEEISTILPHLLALRRITLDHRSLHFGWEAQPESFRLAFLNCLRLQSMQDVCIKDVAGFPFMSALNGECKSIRSLTVHRGRPYKNPSQISGLDLDGPFTNQGLPLKALRLARCQPHFLEGFVPWFTTCRSQLQALEFFSSDGGCYDSLPKLLTWSSGSLTSLDLFLGLTRTPYYDFNVYPIVHKAIRDIPVTLSELPCLEQLTIRASLLYFPKSSARERWGCYSPIPAITRLFSSNTPSLKRLGLNFVCTIAGEDLVQAQSLPWSLLSEVICTPLIQLLSTIFAFEHSGSSSAVQVDLHFAYLMIIPKHDLRVIPLNIIHSLLSGSKELMELVEQGRLTVIPPVPTSININDSEYW